MSGSKVTFTSKKLCFGDSEKILSSFWFKQDKVFGTRSESPEFGFSVHKGPNMRIIEKKSQYHARVDLNISSNDEKFCKRLIVGDRGLGKAEKRGKHRLMVPRTHLGNTLCAPAHCHLIGQMNL